MFPQQSRHSPMATVNSASIHLKTLISCCSFSSSPPSCRQLSRASMSACSILSSTFRPSIPLGILSSCHSSLSSRRTLDVSARAMALDGDYSSKRSSSSEPRETILLPGCDYNHWLIVLEFPKDPAPTREQMVETYLNTLSTVLGSMEEAKKNMYAFSTTTYTGFQCTVSEETSEKFKGLPGVLWVLPDSYIDVKNKDYGGDKYINGEIIPCKYPTYQPRQRSSSKYDSKKYVRQRNDPSERRRPVPGTSQSDTVSS